jgi:TPR repeat protein
MTKAEALNYLARMRHADAFQVAAAFELPYPAAAMALLRLTRQGLVERRLDPESGLYWYKLSAQGRARLAYFEASGDSQR